MSWGGGGGGVNGTWGALDALQTVHLGWRGCASG